MTRTSALVAGAAAFLVALARLRAAHAAPELTLDDARAFMVDLDRLWSDATLRGKPLSIDHFEAYLQSLDPVAASTQPTAAPASPSFKAAGSLLTRKPTAPPAAGAAPSAVAPIYALPVVAVPPAAAQELYRRQAYLSLYLRKHEGLMSLIAQGRTPKDEAGPLELTSSAVQRWGQQAAAAHVELFLIERVAFGEGETQAQKCAAYRRADVHARALKLGTNAPPPSLAPDWQRLLASASRHHAAQHLPFRQELCTESATVTREETRRAVEQKLTETLDARIGGFFATELGTLGETQRAFQGRRNLSAITVPRTEIATLQRDLTDAEDILGAVSDDAKHLNGYIARLADTANDLVGQLSADPESRGALGAQRAELARLNAALSSFVALAKSLGTLTFASASDGAALAPCARLPEEASRDTRLPEQLEACIGAALTLRAQLGQNPHVSPARDQFMRQLQSLSDAYLSINAWSRP